MGVVIPFERRAPKRASTTHGGTQRAGNLSEQSVLATVSDGGDQAAVLAAAAPLLDHCRDRYGFTVMRDGLPSAPEALADAFITLSRGLALLGAEFGGRSIQTYGVYFGFKELAWFEDGYGGMNALAVPPDVNAADIAQFVGPRLRAARG
jgi:hypothetical protein